MLNLDTHILLGSLRGDLDAREKRLLTIHQWGISAIVLWEIAMLAQRNRIEFDLDHGELLRDLARTLVWPIELEICRKLRDLDFKSDPADELIAATSLVHRVPLLTRDKKILKSRIVPFA
ncbi:MAG: PIN domain-containing protein [Deltaproteobacteria bacterium]|nr:PIN domain-containing protein [Deltaproteobacteria bacterium]